jgi:hypothetical protein
VNDRPEQLADQSSAGESLAQLNQTARETGTDHRGRQGH